jgi:hypothetical protein
LKETRLVVGIVPYKLLNGDVAIPQWVVNFGKQILASSCGIITFLVFIYKGHTPSSVHARSQEVLEVVFAGDLYHTGLTGEAHRSNRCHL